MSGGHRPRVRCGLVHAGLAQGAEHFASGCGCAFLGHDHGQDSQMTLGRGFCCKSMHSPSPSAQCKGGVNACASSAHVWPHACASSHLWPPHINQSPFMKLGAVQVLEALAHDCFRLILVIRRPTPERQQAWEQVIYRRMHLPAASYPAPTHRSRHKRRASMNGRSYLHSQAHFEPGNPLPPRPQLCGARTGSMRISAGLALPLGHDHYSGVWPPPGHPAPPECRSGRTSPTNMRLLRRHVAPQVL